MEQGTVNGINLAYTRKGTGAPLVLIHGYPLDHTIWDEVVPLLENDFDMLLPDLRGFGQSEVVVDQYKITDIAADIAGLLDQLSIDNIIVAGHSMGGYVSLAFARSYPERVLGLGLIASQAPADAPESKQGRYKAAEEIMKTGVDLIAEAFAPKLTPNERVQAKVRELIANQQPGGLAGALKAMAEREDSSSILSSFKFPVVLIHGEADELIPFQRAQEIKTAIPHAILTKLPGLGHLPMLEDAPATATALKVFL